MDYIYCNETNCKQFLNVHCTSFSDHKLLYAYELVDDNYGQSLWKLNDSILANEKTISEILEFHDYSNYSADALQEYENFKARLRTSLRHLCIREKRMRELHEEDLLKEISNLEEEMKNNKSKQSFDKYENLLDELKALRFEKNKTQIRSLRSFYLDVNEGNPKSIKNMTSAIRLNNKIRMIKSEQGEVITNQTQILDEFHKWYQKNSIDPVDLESNLMHISEKQEQFVEAFFPINVKSQIDCEEEIVEYEVRKAIYKLKESAPGPDGLTSSLYKKFVDFLRPFL